MLIRRGRIWHYQCKIRGKVWHRSTGETERRRAERKVPALEAQARSLRECCDERPSHFMAAMANEVTRLELDVSSAQAERVGRALVNFAQWAGRDVALAEMTTEMIHEYQRHRVRRDRVARSTMDKEIGYLRRLLRLNGYRVEAPPRLRAGYVRHRRFTDDELVAFFGASTDRCRPLWLFLLATGARLAEVLPSTRGGAHVPVLASEVDWSTGRVDLRCAKVKPNEESVTVPKALPAELLPVLREVADSHGGETLFPRLYKPSRSFDATLRRAGLQKRTPQGKMGIHSFRTTYASKLGEVAGSAWVVKDAMGHKHIKTTQAYVQPQAQVLPVSMLHLMGGAGDTKEGYRGPASVHEAHEQVE